MPSKRTRQTQPARPPHSSARSNVDILMSIRPEHIRNIAAGRKTHEYRKYRLPSSVKRIWFYTSAPVSSIEYVAEISSAKPPGEVPGDGGIGNSDFNAGWLEAMYGYEVLRLWKLKQPIGLTDAKSRGYLKGPPQKYNWAPLQLLEDYPLASQDFMLCTEQQSRQQRRDGSLQEGRPAKIARQAIGNDCDG